MKKTSIENNCSVCGYPVIVGMRKCPNCNAIVSQTKKMICPHCEAEIEGEEQFCLYCGGDLYGNASTEEPADRTAASPHQETIPECTLRPLETAGERTFPTRTYTGSEVMLSRFNTLPSDPSIEEELQAGLFFFEGKWYIEERCEGRRSTYVHAGQAIKLEPGDIIKMGDREFEFNSKLKKQQR